MMTIFLKRKEKVILSAIDIISELGLQGLSVKEICTRQEISEGTLYKHFRSKDEIILGVLDFYEKFDFMRNETIKLKKMSSKESIRYCLGLIAEYYENYPAITAIPANYQAFMHESATIAEKNLHVFQSHNTLIINYIKDGIISGEFKSDIDAEILSFIIIGMLRNIILVWRLENYSFSFKRKVMSALDMLLENF